MAGTLLHAVRRAVVAGIGAKLVEVGGFPDTESRLLWRSGVREQVYTTRATFTHESASMRAGRTHRDERGRFDLVVLVGLPETAEDVADRAAAIGVVAEEWVADHRSTLGVTGVNWINVTGRGSMTEYFGDRANYCELVYPVEYDARLT